MLIDIHILSSFLMVAAILAHLVLHWKWMAAMTRNMAQSREETSGSSDMFVQERQEVR